MIYNVIRACYIEHGSMIYNHGTMLLDMCKQTGLRIMNGRCGEDKSGKYTH